VIDLRSEVVDGRMLDPRAGFQRVRTRVEFRWDPLTGHVARLMTGSRLMPPNDFDLEALATQTREGCPFCPEALESMTPRLDPDIFPFPDGRIHRGEAVLFPNIVSYSLHSAVSVYSPGRHFLPLSRMTARLVADNLGAQVAFGRAAVRGDPRARWVSVNANHMLPSGSSLFHPHLQGSADPFPSTQQRLLSEVPAERFGDYVETERGLGRRYAGSTGRVEWLASFAPIAPAELRGFLFGVASPADLGEEDVAELGDGIARALNLYAELGFESFNLAIYGAPPGTPECPLNLRIAARSNLRAPAYRSDATYFERLHWDSAVDVWPEDVAERARPFFAP
jgi:UDPglucose--hexose-1-phosphate uridylyltransferase